MAKKDFRFGISAGVAGVDLNQLLVNHAASTFFMRLAEDKPDIEVYQGDVVVVDRALDPKNNDIVVVEAESEQELGLVRLADKPGELMVWGVVVYVIRKLRK